MHSARTAHNTNQHAAVSAARASRLLTCVLCPAAPVSGPGHSQVTTRQATHSLAANLVQSLLFYLLASAAGLAGHNKAAAASEPGHLRVPRSDSGTNKSVHFTRISITSQILGMDIFRILQCAIFPPSKHSTLLNNPVYICKSHYLYRDYFPMWTFTDLSQ